MHIDKPDGTLKTSSYGSQTASYSYNLANLLTEVNNANSGTQISKYNYTYYVDGNQKSKSESVAVTDKGTTNYTYDGVNRLVTEQAPDKTFNYQYDSYGNRSQLSVTGDEMKRRDVKSRVFLFDKWVDNHIVLLVE